MPKAEDVLTGAMDSCVTCFDLIALRRMCRSLAFMTRDLEAAI